jgi:hypothetical protein
MRGQGVNTLYVGKPAVPFGPSEGGEFPEGLSQRRPNLFLGRRRNRPLVPTSNSLSFIG